MTLKVNYIELRRDNYGDREWHGQVILRSDDDDDSLRQKVKLSPEQVATVVQLCEEMANPHVERTFDGVIELERQLRLGTGQVVDADIEVEDDGFFTPQS